MGARLVTGLCARLRWCRVVRPTAHSLFFVSPKKSKQKKSDPTVCVPSLRYGQPAVLAAGGVTLELGYRLRQSRALIHLPLCSSAHTEGAQSNLLVALCATLHWGPGRAERTKRCNARQSRASSAARYAVVRRRVAQGWADQGSRLFEAIAEFERDPARTEQRSVPEALLRDDAFGSPFLCLLSFGEAKESECAAGRISRQTPAAQANSIKAIRPPERDPAPVREGTYTC